MIPCTPEAYDLMHEGCLVMAKISSNGIRIDTKYLRNTREQIQKEIKDIKRELMSHPYWKLWQKRYGLKSNITSTDQLATLLYEELDYPVVAYTNTGKPSTDVQALEQIDDPFVRTYTRMSKRNKAEGTFLAGIERETRNNRLRPFFNTHTTVTYRSSSDAFNFQNIPVRDEEISEIIRRCFIPRKGRHIVEIDCSGVEVRISACYHKDPMMIKYIIDPTPDMHRDMACELFMCKPDQVTKQARHASKNGFVFPEFYGSYWRNVGSDLWDVMNIRKLELNVRGEQVLVRDHIANKGIHQLGDPENPQQGDFLHHVKKVDEHFWNKRFSVYNDWKKSFYSDYLKVGGWRTKTGFYVTGIYKKNDVTNHPIQGSAFHCLLWGLIRLQRWLEKKGMKTLIIGQIHDSVVLDSPPDEIDIVLDKWKRIMEVDLPRAWDWIIVPMIVEAEVAPLGKSWFDKEEWVRSDSGWSSKV